MRGGLRAAVCAIGPGIVGTGTSFGHGGLAAADAANAAAALGGRPVLAPRVSLADARERQLSRTTPVRCCASASGTSRLLGPRAWSRQTFQWKRSMSPAGRRRASGCRCRTWVAAPRRIRGSSPRRSRPGGWRVGSPRVELDLKRRQRPPKADAFSFARRGSACSGSATAQLAISTAPSCACAAMCRAPRSRPERRRRPGRRRSGGGGLPARRVARRRPPCTR